MESTKKIIQKNLQSEPIIIPNDAQKPIPLMLRFVEEPEIKIPIQMGGSTYLGTTPVQGGEVGDFMDDDQ